MKQRSTTPVSSKSLATKGMLIAGAILMGIAAPISIFAAPVQARDYAAEINAIQRQIDQYQATARQLSDQVKTLRSEVDRLSNEKAVIQAQIDLSQSQYDKLVADIAENEQKIDKLQGSLGDILAKLHVGEEISPLEMLASSSNISQYLDQQAQREAVRDGLKETIDEIDAIKKQLQLQKEEVKKVLDEQTTARNALAAKEAEQQKLLAETQGQESAYQKLSADSEAKKLQIQRQQQAEIEAAIRRSGGGSTLLAGDPNKGGYPWAGNCYVDRNAYSHGGVFYPGAGGYTGLDGMGRDSSGSGAYGCNQCVSYAAWKVYQKTGEKWHGMGNANMWPGRAPRPTGSTPRANSLGVISAGTYGHIVYIESVNGDGTVNISQYNYLNAGGPGWGHYSEMRVSASTYDTYIYL